MNRRSFARRPLRRASPSMWAGSVSDIHIAFDQSLASTGHIRLSPAIVSAWAASGTALRKTLILSDPVRDNWQDVLSCRALAAPKSMALLARRETEQFPVGAGEARGILETAGNSNLADAHRRMREQALPPPQPHAAIVLRGRHAGVGDE